MGEVAGHASDVVVLTSDNPRSEDPLLIINDVIVGVQRTKAKLFVEPDRQKAIEVALDEVPVDDVAARRIYERFQGSREAAIITEIRQVCGVLIGTPV